MTAETATLIAAAIAALAALFAAGISAYTAYFQSTRSAELRLAEFRREWIEDLRSALARFSAKSADRFLALKSGLVGTDSYFQYDYNYILLKLNPAEPYTIELSERMAAVITINNEMLAASQNGTLTQDTERDSSFRENINGFNKVAYKILKSEWDRMKVEMKVSTSESFNQSPPTMK